MSLILRHVCLKPFNTYNSENLVLRTLHMNCQAHMACNFNYVVETEGLLKVTSSHVHCRSGTISEMLQEHYCCRPL